MDLEMDKKIEEKRKPGRPSNAERGVIGRVKANNSFRPDTPKQLGTVTLAKMIADVKGLKGWNWAVDIAIENLAREMELL